MTIQIRQAQESDRGAILEISSQVWEGTDYIPKVLDRWLQGNEGLLWCSEYEGVVAGFSKMTFLSDHSCWMEGIRVSKDYRGKGIGRALTSFQINECFKRGYNSCRLSSYFENCESLHIVQTQDFKRVGSFKVYGWSPTDCKESQKAESLCEIEKQNRNEILKSCHIKLAEPSDINWIIDQMANSERLAKRSMFLSYDWTFEKFSEKWIRQCVAEGDFYRITQNDETGFFSLSGKHAKGNLKTVNFISDGVKEDAVLSYAIEEALGRGEEGFGYMAADNESEARFKEIGLTVYDDEKQDVFVFEMKGSEA